MELAVLGTRCKIGPRQAAVLDNLMPLNGRQDTMVDRWDARGQLGLDAALTGGSEAAAIADSKCEWVCEASGNLDAKTEPPLEDVLRAPALRYERFRSILHAVRLRRLETTQLGRAGRAVAWRLEARLRGLRSPADDPAADGDADDVSDDGDAAARPPVDDDADDDRDSPDGGGDAASLAARAEAKRQERCERAKALASLGHFGAARKEIDISADAAAPSFTEPLDDRLMVRRFLAFGVSSAEPQDRLACGYGIARAGRATFSKLRRDDARDAAAQAAVGDLRLQHSNDATEAFVLAAAKAAKAAADGVFKDEDEARSKKKTKESSRSSRDSKRTRRSRSRSSESPRRRSPKKREEYGAAAPEERVYISAFGGGGGGGGETDDDAEPSAGPKSPRRGADSRDDFLTGVDEENYFSYFPGLQRARSVGAKRETAAPPQFEAEPKPSRRRTAAAAPRVAVAPPADAAPAKKMTPAERLRAKMRANFAETKTTKAAAPKRASASPAANDRRRIDVAHDMTGARPTPGKALILAGL